MKKKQKRRPVISDDEDTNDAKDGDAVDTGSDAEEDEDEEEEEGREVLYDSEENEIEGDQEPQNFKGILDKKGR